MRDFDAYEHADPALKKLREDAVDWRASQEITNNKRAKVNRGILACRAAGVSYERIRAATGLGMATIQDIAKGKLQE